ncbi:ssDNA binding protein [Delphinella strobiligena]|nr:ssDNA binding protein [Delphinella strobiligena]
MFASSRLGLRTANATRAFSTTRANALARMQLIGRLADQPELTPTSTGREMVRYAIGVSTGAKDEQGNRATSWFRVASFSEGPGRDLLLSLPKGSLIHVDAEARMDTFQTADGQQQTRLNLVQRSFETLSRPRNIGAESDRTAVEEPLSGLGAS